MKFEKGTMIRASVPIGPDGPFPFTPFHPQRPTPERRQILHRVPLDAEHQQEMLVEDPQDHNSDDDFASIENNFPQLFDCLSVDGFDTEQFKVFARDFLRELAETSRNDPATVQKEKAKVVSVLAQNVYIMCTLTKDQIKNITAFWKAMIPFITPEAEATAKKIHVSYSSCVREARRINDQTRSRQLELLRNCCYFSLALDPAKFGRDNYLSCVGRFGFEDQILQEILFFEKVSVTTGHEIARFIVEKLEEKNCDFTKLVSITTDGASNMIGQERGMANEIIRMANEKHHQQENWPRCPLPVVHRPQAQPRRPGFQGG